MTKNYFFNNKYHSTSQCHIFEKQLKQNCLVGLALEVLLAFATIANYRELAKSALLLCLSFLLIDENPCIY